MAPHCAGSPCSPRQGCRRCGGGLKRGLKEGAKRLDTSQEGHVSPAELMQSKFNINTTEYFADSGVAATRACYEL